MFSDWQPLGPSQANTLYCQHHHTQDCLHAPSLPRLQARPPLPGALGVLEYSSREHFSGKYLPREGTALRNFALADLSEEYGVPVTEACLQ